MYLRELRGDLLHRTRTKHGNPVRHLQTQKGAQQLDRQPGRMVARQFIINTYEVFMNISFRGVHPFRSAVTQLLLIVGFLSISSQSVAMPIGTGNTGDDWKTACAGADGGKYGCCQGKFDDCTSTTKPGQPAYGKCRTAYKTCVSKAEVRTQTKPPTGSVSPAKSQ
jgi:hypothetical protein